MAKGAIGTCHECGKQCFSTRKAARNFHRRYLPGEAHLAVYRCGDYFHFGHKPYLVQRGVISRDALAS